MGFVFIIGIANFRLAAYQDVWSKETWVCLIGAVLMYGIGYLFSNNIAVKAKRNIDSPKTMKRYYYFGVLMCVLMVLAFITKWCVAGSIPLFDWDDAHTYVRFMSGERYLDVLRAKMINHEFLFKCVKAWHRFSNIFSFQGWLASALVYVYYKKGNPTLREKTVVLVVIVLSIINPILMVVREIFLMQTVSFAVLGYLINDSKKQKCIIVTGMLILTVFGYHSMSNSRGFSAERLADTFEMAEESVKNESDEEVKTSYPATFIWIYTYFTCGFDNFNHLTKTLDYQTYGLMQARPIFSALQIDGLKDIDEALQKPKYRVSPNVTIYTFLVDAYVDFRLLGVATSMLVWGVVFGIVSKKTNTEKDLTFTIIYAGVAHHIIFMFFSPWMDHFSYLCSFGLLLIFYVVSELFYKKDKG